MNTRLTTTLLIAGMLVGCGGGGGGGGGTTPTTDPATAPKTLEFTESDFNAVSIDGSFEATIQQGPEFRVEITIDGDEADKLDVHNIDGRLQLGFIPNVDVRADTLRAFIVMPNIEAITLTGSVSASLINFAGANLVVSLNGNVVLEGQGGRFDYLMGTVGGSSLLEFVDVTALPAADVELNGSSAVTLNLMDFATVTGTLGGTASFSYYGSQINLQLDAAPPSSIARLGDTRGS